MDLRNSTFQKLSKTFKPVLHQCPLDFNGVWVEILRASLFLQRCKIPALLEILEKTMIVLKFLTAACSLLRRVVAVNKTCIGHLVLRRNNMVSNIIFTVITGTSTSWPDLSTLRPAAKTWKWGHWFHRQSFAKCGCQTRSKLTPFSTQVGRPSTKNGWRGVWMECWKSGCADNSWVDQANRICWKAEGSFLLPCHRESNVIW